MSEERKARVKPSDEDQTAVVTASRRRCCLCYYLDDDKREKKGQVAHLDKNPAHSVLDNLVWLCFAHHDAYDSKTSQSKNYIEGEVRQWRDTLHKELEPVAHEISLQEKLVGSTPRLRSLALVFEQEERLLSFLNEPWRGILWNETVGQLFAYKAAPSDGVCWVRLLGLTDRRTMVLCTQVLGNPGPSITNAVELLAFQVCNRFEIEPENLVWIEHYGQEFGLDHFARVDFAVMPPQGMFGKPSWHKMERPDWQELGIPKPRKI